MVFLVSHQLNTKFTFHDDVKPLLLHGKVRTQLLPSHFRAIDSILVWFGLGFYSKWIGIHFASKERAKCVPFQLIIIKLVIFHVRFARIAYEWKR